MLKKFQDLKQKPFLRSVSVLVSGTAVGQLINFLVMPILSRMYSPEQFGVFGLYSSLVGIVSVIACLRFDLALGVCNQESEEEAIHLLTLSFLSAASFFSLFCIIIAWQGKTLTYQLGLEALHPYLWFIPLGILGSSSYSALMYWHTRKKQFSSIAKTRITQAAGASLTQIGLGSSSWGALGLILGQVINFSAGCGRLFKEFYSRDLPRVTFAQLKLTFLKNKNYPLYSTFTALASSSSYLLPLLLIASVGPLAEVGYLNIAMRVTQIPLALLGGAVAQVYTSRLAEQYQGGSLDKFTGQAITGMSRIGTGPLLFMALLAPDVASLALGTEWRRAGELVTWMSPWVFIQFISSPFSNSLQVTGYQRLALILQLLGLLLRCSAVLLTAQLNARWIVQAYTLSSALFYILFLSAVGYATQISPSLLIRSSLSGVPRSLIWGLGAGLLLLCYHWLTP